jgi:cellobiose dehydrogenase (acceptor)
LFDDLSQPSFNTSTSQDTFEQGWAQSSVSPVDKTNPDSAIQQHNNGMGEFQIKVANATNASYAKWAALATAVPTASASAAPSSNATATVVPPTATPTPTKISEVLDPSATSYDYIVVGGGGAAGISMADKLSAAGHKVLLVEKGVASSAGISICPDPRTM